MDGVDQIQLAQCRMQRRTSVNTIMNFRSPYKVRSILTSWANIILSRRTLLHGI